MPIKPHHETILDINPYSPSSAKKVVAEKLIRLSSNENALGVSPNAIEAYKRSAENIFRYPDASCSDLKKELAKFYNLEEEKILCGSGSDDLLRLITSVFAGPGDEVIYSEYGFLVYQLAALAVGAKPVEAKEKNYKTDIDEILSKVNDKTKVIFIANPNNPTGTYIPFSEIKRLHENISSKVLLVLDSAYSEFVDDDDYEDGIEFSKTHSNIIITKTFSKIYGLSGLRVGWAYCSSSNVIDYINRVRNVFILTEASQACAIEALRDKDFMAKSKAHAKKWIPQLTKLFKEKNFEVTDSRGNFLMITATQKNKFTIDEFHKYLLEHGVDTKPLASYKLPNSMRISIGSDEEMEKLINLVNNYC